MLDKDGYPTDKTLEEIEKWDPTDFHGLAEFLCENWLYPNYAKLKGDILEISTGGWSGHEDMLSCLSPVWRLMWFQSQRRGGHWVFGKSDLENNVKIIICYHDANTGKDMLEEYEWKCVPRMGETITINDATYKILNINWKDSSNGSRVEIFTESK